MKKQGNDNEMSVTEGALLLGKSYNEVWRLVLKGIIRSRRDGAGHFLLRRSDVEKLRDT